jgi:hypothetical protein
MSNALGVALDLRAFCVLLISLFGVSVAESESDSLKLYGEIESEMYAFLQDSSWDNEVIYSDERFYAITASLELGDTKGLALYYTLYRENYFVPHGGSSSRGLGVAMRKEGGEFGVGPSVLVIGAGGIAPLSMGLNLNYLIYKNFSEISFSPLIGLGVNNYYVDYSYSVRFGVSKKLNNSHLFKITATIPLYKYFSESETKNEYLRGEASRRIQKGKD